MNREFALFLVIIALGWLFSLVTTNLAPHERSALRWAALVPVAYLVVWRLWLRRPR